MIANHGDPIIGNIGNVVWTAFKAALPLVATVLMYALAIRSAAAQGRSKIVVHLTYVTVFALLIPNAYYGMLGSLEATDAPMGIIVDVAGISALIYGGFVFWLFRGIEIGIQKYRQRRAQSNLKASPRT